jgi:hypothetical protein
LSHDASPGHASATRAGSQSRSSLVCRSVLVLALCLGVWLRVAEIGAAFLFGDELHSLSDMHGGYLHLLQTFSDTGSGMLLPLLQRGLIDLFGANHWAIRAPAWTAGLALLFVTYPLARRQLSDGLAVAVTTFVALSPILVFYSHFARIYALCALLCLLLLDRIEAVQARDAKPPTGKTWALLIFLTALLPYAHPTSLGFVVPVYFAAIGVAAMDPARRGIALRLAGSLAAAGLLCLLAHLPAWSSLDAFVNNKTTTPYRGGFGLSDVAALVFGGRSFGQAALVLGILAAAASLRRRRAEALPLLAACLGPALIIALVSPYGGAYAYARYVLPSLVPFLLMLARSIDLLLERGDASNPKATQTGVAVAMAAVALWVSWPVVAATANNAHGQHANTYLAMRPLSGFDAKWPGASTFYATLAQEVAARPDLRVVEAPALTTRTRHLYRTHQRQHGATTELAPFRREFPRIPNGPYVSLDRAVAATNLDVADYLIVHLNIAGEVQRYWDFVYGDAIPRDPDDRAYMERHQTYGGLLPPASAGLIDGLEARLGEPVYRDGDVVVWAIAQ